MASALAACGGASAAADEVEQTEWRHPGLHKHARHHRSGSFADGGAIKSMRPAS